MPICRRTSHCPRHGSAHSRLDTPSLYTYGRLEFAVCAVTVSRVPPLYSLSVFAEVGVTDLRSDVELGRLDLQLGGLIDCCSFRARSEYQVSSRRIAVFDSLSAGLSLKETRFTRI